jgi:hypothetical protein
MNDHARNGTKTNWPWHDALPKAMSARRLYKRVMGRNRRRTARAEVELGVNDVAAEQTRGCDWRWCDETYGCAHDGGEMPMTERLLCTHVIEDEARGTALLILELQSVESINLPRRATRVCEECIDYVLEALAKVDGQALAAERPLRTLEELLKLPAFEEITPDGEEGIADWLARTRRKKEEIQRVRIAELSELFDRACLNLSSVTNERDWQRQRIAELELELRLTKENEK